jgi:hypothetical protein
MVEVSRQRLPSLLFWLKVCLLKLVLLSVIVVIWLQYGQVQEKGCLINGSSSKLSRKTERLFTIYEQAFCLWKE